MEKPASKLLEKVREVFNIIPIYRCFQFPVAWPLSMRYTACHGTPIVTTRNTERGVSDNDPCDEEPYKCERPLRTR